MATSTNYSVDRDTLIKMAYENIGIGVEGEDLQPEYIKVAARWLNLQIKNYTILGFHLWKRERLSISLTAGQSSYTIGQKTRGTTTATTANKLVDNNADFVSSVSVGDTILNTTDSTSTTISSIDSTDILTVASDIFVLGDAYEVTSANQSLPRPDRILECTRKNSSNIEVRMNPISLEEYERLPNKSQAGVPISYFYDPELSNGRLYLWLTPSAVEVAEYTIEIVAATQVNDMDDSTDEFDFPQEWLLPIVINLSAQLGTVYGGMSSSATQLMSMQAKQLLDDVADYDQDATSIYFQPNLTRGR